MPHITTHFQPNTSLLNSSLGNINIYVDTDKKLHFVDKDGADSVIPFSGIDFKSLATNITSYTVTNDLDGKYGIVIMCSHSGSSSNPASFSSNLAGLSDYTKFTVYNNAYNITQVFLGKFIASKAITITNASSRGGASMSIFSL